MSKSEKTPADREKDNESSKPVRKVSTGAWWKSSIKTGDKPEKKKAAPKKAAPKKAAKEKPQKKTTAKAKPKPQPQPKRSPKPAVKRNAKAVDVKAADTTKTEAVPEVKKEEIKKETTDTSSKKAEQPSEKQPQKAKRGQSRNEKSDKPDSAKQKKEKKVISKLLINAEEPEECRIALLENGRLESFHVNTVVRERTKNNIYKGRIVAVEANLQSAFVEIGTGRNGFLPFSDIHPEYYKADISEKSRKLIKEQQWKKLKIEDVVQRGQEVLVQVVKEVTGNKGANMTTYLSLPGRSLVLMPGSDSHGISRKIAGEGQRGRLREIMNTLKIPEGIGYIVRTASAEITKTALQLDLRFLLGLWKEIKEKGQSSETPALVFEEQDTVVRFLRDHFVPDIQEITVDTQESYEQVTQFVSLLPARQKKVQVRLHKGVKPLFNQNNIEEQIESIYQPQVPLPSGGSIVIDPTEALVAIDVNSGRTSKKGDFEESIFLANMEAADELARQLRLRDLGGLIVVDFIDMRSKKHIKDVEKQVKNAMKRDKAKVGLSRISRFGLMQISRQKMGAPIEKGSYRRCEYCDGRGVVRSVETLALFYLRRIQTGVSRKNVSRVEARLPLEVGQYLLNKKRLELTELESKHQSTIDIIPRPEMKPGENKIDFLSAPVKTNEQA